MAFKRQGALIVPEKELTPKLEKHLTVSGSDFMSKEFEYQVFRYTNGSVAIPRYALGVTAFLLSSGRRPVTRLFPKFRKSLWPEQKKGIKEAFDVLKMEHGVFLKAEPGSGKTVAALCLAASLRPNRVFIMVDQDNLADQWTKRILEFVPDATVTYVMPLASQRALHKKYDQRRMLDGIQRHDLRGDFVVCMTQSLIAHPKPLQADLLIVDECHVFSAPTFSNAIFNIDFYYSIALSANETRPDGLEWIFREMLGTTKVVMKGKRLPAKAQFFPVSTKFLDWADPIVSDMGNWFRKLWCTEHKKQTTRYDCSLCPRTKEFRSTELSVITRRCGSFWKHDEFEENSLERHLGHDSAYNGWLLDTIETFLEAKRDIFVFARLREPLERLHGLIEMNFGPVSGLYLGHATTAAMRERNARALKRPITLCTYQKAGKGLDVARKDGIICASPISKSRLNQVIGRVERLLTGKMRPVVVHPIVPFVTSKARMKGCVRWYRENKYDYEIHPDLARCFGDDRY
jgi:superfamily II DNA or RNA helicase